MDISTSEIILGTELDSMGKKDQKERGSEGAGGRESKLGKSKVVGLFRHKLGWIWE